MSGRVRPPRPSCFASGPRVGKRLPPEARTTFRPFLCITTREIKSLACAIAWTPRRRWNLREKLISFRHSPSSACRFGPVAQRIRVGRSDWRESAPRKAKSVRPASAAPAGEWPNPALSLASRRSPGLPRSTRCRGRLREACRRFRLCRRGDRGRGSTSGEPSSGDRPRSSMEPSRCRTIFPLPGRTLSTLPEF